jgi:hypothetical protein
VTISGIDDSVNLPKPEPASVLSVQGRILVEALTRKSVKSRRAIAMYMEAMRAIARNDGPEALHIAAYELREFMNALPAALDMPVVSHPQLNDKARTFVGEWKRRSTRSDCLKDGKWDGQIDEELRGLLITTTTFVTWIDLQVPSRKVEAASVLQKLAPTEHPLPRSLVKMRTDEWGAMLGYFNVCAHHRHEPDPVAFRRKVEELEGFLLDHLEPRTFDDQSDIDRLIEEVEGQ